MSAVIDRVRRANPVPPESGPFADPEAFRTLVMKRSGLIESTPLDLSEEVEPPETVMLSEPLALFPSQRSRRKRWMVATVGFVLIVLVATAGFVAVRLAEPDTGIGVVGPPPPTPEEQALRTSVAFFAALTAGDAEAALALMQPAVLEDPTIRPAVEFAAALPGSKMLSNCSTTTGSSGVTVHCETSFNGPLFQASDQVVRFGSVTIGPDGLVSSLPTLGIRSLVDRNFVEYATQAAPEAFNQACAPEAYEPRSVITVPPGYAATGPCGELRAQLADDAAAWVAAGKPDLTG